MLLYVNGCSITHGNLVGFDNSWANIIAKNNDLQLVNESKCGAGNDFIFHKTLESVSKLIDNNEKPELVIIQWSGPNRRLHCDIDGNYYYVNLTDHLKYQPKYEPMGSEHTIHYMFSLQEFLYANEIKHYFFNYMDLDYSVKLLNIYKKIDWKNDLGITIIDLKKIGLVADDFGHPSLDGQYWIANNISKKLDYNKIEHVNRYRKDVKLL
jgi:hypothetical protein